MRCIINVEQTLNKLPQQLKYPYIIQKNKMYDTIQYRKSKIYCLLTILFRNSSFQATKITK